MRVVYIPVYTRVACLGCVFCMRVLCVLVCMRLKFWLSVHSLAKYFMSCVRNLLECAAPIHATHTHTHNFDDSAHLTASCWRNGNGKGKGTDARVVGFVGWMLSTAEDGGRRVFCVCTKRNNDGLACVWVKSIKLIVCDLPLKGSMAACGVVHCSLRMVDPAVLQRTCMHAWRILL